MKKRNKIKKKIIVLFLFVAMLSGFWGNRAHAQKKRGSASIGFGVEMGQWLPSRLTDNAELSSLKSARQNPYVGIVILKPWRSFALRFSGGYWEYHGEKSKSLLQISSVAMDMKYSMLADIWFSPYVIYGIGWFLGNEHTLDDPDFSYLQNPELGLGFNVGAGFDFRIYKFNIAVEFKYHYVTFSQIIGPTDNFSGPKISVQGIYFF
ncbi:MAG: outer membrane beta-barrel protein [Calditrichaeota bacterium]|nr:outer membrane beta-barrel protein [Calditrichota bacterium]